MHNSSILKEEKLV